VASGARAAGYDHFTAAHHRPGNGGHEWRADAVVFRIERLIQTHGYRSAGGQQERTGCGGAGSGTCGAIGGICRCAGQQ
jgi:hypothetical protein